MSSPQCELNTSSFMGQMVARYRERMTMGFPMTNAINPEAYSTILSETAEESLTQRGGDNETTVGAAERRDTGLDAKPVRSQSNLSHSSYFPKPSMKELITKFERRSLTANQLKENEPRAKERKQFREIGPAVCEEETTKLDSPEKKASLPPSYKISLSPLVTTSPVKFESKPETVVCEPMENFPEATNATNNTAVPNTAERSATPLGQYESQEGEKPLTPVAESGPHCEDHASDGQNREIEVKVDSSDLMDGWATPSQNLMTEVGSDTPSPLRTSLRGIARTKMSPVNESKFVVHKKDWSKRYDPRLTTASLAYSPYTVHETLSKTKSDGGRSVTNAPSNTLQRAEIRRTLHELDTKHESQQSASRSDLQSNAMERYMNFLKNTPPPTPTTGADKTVLTGGSCRPPTPRRSQIVNKNKKNQLKSVLNSAKATGCTVVTNKLKSTLNRDNKSDVVKAKSGLDKMKPKTGVTTVKVTNPEVTTKPKRLVDKKKKLLKSKINSICKDTQVDRSCGDVGAMHSTASTIGFTAGDGRGMSINDQRSTTLSVRASRSSASKLPTKIPADKLSVSKNQNRAKKRDAFTTKQASSDRVEDLTNVDIQKHESVSPTVTKSAQGTFVAQSTAKEEVPKIGDSIRKEASAEKAEKRATSSPARLSSRLGKRAMQSPKDIRIKLFQGLDKDLSDSEDKLLSDRELANNDLIPLQDNQGLHEDNLAINRFGFRAKQSPVKVTRPIPRLRNQSFESDFDKQEQYLTNHDLVQHAIMSPCFIQTHSRQRENYHEDSECTTLSQTDCESVRYAFKHDVMESADFCHSDSGNNEDARLKKSLNTNSNLVPETLSSLSQYKDVDKSPNEDPFILTNFDNRGKRHRMEIEPPRRTVLTKGSPVHKGKHKAETDPQEDESVMDIYSSFTRDWTNQFLIAASRGNDHDDSQEVCNSFSKYYSGNPLYKVAHSSDDGQSTATNSPVTKKRHIEKKKKKKKKRKEESVDKSEVSLSQMDMRKVPHLKEKRDGSARIIKQADLLRVKEHPGQSSEYPEPHRHNELPKSLDHVKHQNFYRHRQSGRRSIDQTKAQEIPAIPEDLRYLETSKSDIVTPSHSFYESPKAVISCLVVYKPVQPVSSVASWKFGKKSDIPVITYSKAPSKRKFQTLLQRRRWVEGYTNKHPPSCLPVSQSFRKTLWASVQEEYAMHSWFPNVPEGYNSYIVGNQDRELMFRMDNGPLLDSPRFSKEWWVEFLALLPYRKVGPIRMSTVGYFTLVLSVTLVAYVSVGLYNCGGSDYDYFCEDNDVGCFVRASNNKAPNNPYY